MQIDGKQIGSGHQPWVCAEISGEHKGSYSRCIDLIAAAKLAGADACKLQLFDPAKLAEARGGFNKVLTDGLWKGRMLGELYRETCTPRGWFPGLFAYAKDIGITLFSSVFDEEGVDYLESLGCPAYKISSFELTDLALIRKAAKTGKPIIISTGMAAGNEVHAALRAATGPVDPLVIREDVPLEDIDLRPGTIHWVDTGFGGVALLHCVSSYPCNVADAQLSRLIGLQHYDCPVGLSDHTLGSIAPVAATALGASIIEKHITLDRKNGGPDAPFSLEPAEFAKMVQDVKDAYASLGTGERPASEGIYRELRRKG